MVINLIWEQEVPSSNLGAPTNNFKHLGLSFFVDFGFQIHFRYPTPLRTVFQFSNLLKILEEIRGHPIIPLSREKHKHFLLFDFNRIKHWPFSGRSCPYIFLIKFRRFPHSTPSTSSGSKNLASDRYIYPQCLQLRPAIIPNQDFAVQ
jgi:hypothetical protein